MIIEFKFKNYKSYKDEAILSFEALENDYKKENYFTVDLESGEKVRLLKSAAILGANASGKSNVIWALYTLCFFVINSRNFDNRTQLPGYVPFVFNGGKLQPTEMTIDFIAKNKRYRYKIVFDTSFHYEGLFEITGRKEQLVFKAEENKDKSGFGLIVGDAWPSTSFDLSQNYISNQLFLSICGVRPQNGLQEIYGVLADIMSIPIGDTINLKVINDSVSDNIIKNNKSDLFGQLKKLIHIADIGVHDVHMQEHTEEEFKFPEFIPESQRKQFVQAHKWEVKMIHKSNGKDYPLDMELESTGTKYLFGMGARVLDVLNRGGLLACDEMNIATHPELFKLLVSLFNNTQSNPKNAQLLFTTHDASVMADGAFRADQVWFAEKNYNGESELFSAQDFDGVGISIPFDAWYRSGRFGALPKFGHINYIFTNESEEKADERQ